MNSPSIRVGRFVMIMLLTLALIHGPQNDDPGQESTSGSGAESGFGRSGQWTALPAAPLEARYEADGVWVADRFVVIGGWSSSMCPPSASCLPPVEPARRDGASFDPATGRWTRIADAPVPVSAWNTVALNGLLYLLTGDQNRDDSPDAFLSYDPQRDTWTSLALPPTRGWLVATDSAIVRVASTDEHGAAIDAAFDPRTNQWRKLPDDPLGPSFSRSVIWIDGSLLLAAQDLVSNPGSDQPSLVRLARLDDDLSRWSTLPDSEIIEYTPVAVGGLAVWPYPGSKDGRGGDRVMVGNQLLNPATGQWSTVPPLPGAQRTAATTVGSPQALLVWGGSIPARPPKNYLAVENVATGYLFRPAAEPATVAPTATASEEATSLKCTGGGRYAADRPDLTGQQTSDVRQAERARGHEVRLVGTDGICSYRRSDLRRDRVNLYSENGIVVWAQMF